VILELVVFVRPAALPINTLDEPVVFAVPAAAVYTVVVLLVLTILDILLTMV
jgi:hypothetical protein